LLDVFLGHADGRRHKTMIFMVKDLTTRRLDLKQHKKTSNGTIHMAKLKVL
jgi:hypothetical protein